MKTNRSIGRTMVSINGWIWSHSFSPNLN